MNIYMPRLALFGRVLLLLSLICLTASMAVGQGKRTFVAGEIILYCQPGTSLATANAIAAKVQPASVTPLLLANCYTLELPAARRTDADTLAAVTTLKGDPNVRWVGPSRLHVPLDIPKATPNDPMYSKQWNLPLINMPQAWVLQKGQPGHNVAWIDSGFDPKHEDAKGQFDPGSYDFADNDSDITADGSGADFDHGTHTSGIAIAITNNSIGIAGIDWQNIKCVGLKIQPKGQPNLSTTAILNSYAYIAAHRNDLHIDACNMSYGGPGDPNDVNDPEYQGVKSCVDAGVIMVGSAGNGGNTDVNLPAFYPFVISVSAVNPAGKLTYYSTYGKVELAAPGGEQTTDTDPNGILSLRQNSTYGFAQGTSDAAPHVTAVAALLTSTPGVTQKLAIKAMEDTANRTGLTQIPDAKYGYGLLDAYAALLRVSVTAVILDPAGVTPNGQSTDPSGVTPPVETLKPLLRFHLSNVPLSNLVITIDGRSFSWTDVQNNAVPGVSDVQPIQGNPSGDNPDYIVAFRYSFPSGTPEQHTIAVTGTNPNSGTSSTDTRIITIQPHTFSPGLSFVSIPYFESAQDSPTGQFRNANQLLAPDATLFRWLDTQATNAQGLLVAVGKYAQYGPGISDALSVYASLQPPDVVTNLAPTQQGDPSDVRPLGLAWFLHANANLPVVTYGVDYPRQAVRIPLHEGWNMVGDPFRFTVPFNTAVIQNGDGTQIPIQQAADQKLVLPTLFRLVSGQYEYDTLPGGAFHPWEGHWLYVVPKDPNNLTYGNTLFIIIPPTQVSGADASGGGRAAVKAATSNSSAANNAGGWRVQLQARTHDLADTNNYIGMSPHATDGEDTTKVPKPPLPSPYVSLGLARAHSLAGVYTQDLRSFGGSKSWDVVVNTDQPDADVVVSWSGLTTVPKNYRLSVTDKTSGQTIDMAQQSSMTFHTGHTGGSRSYVVTARPTNAGGKALLTNIFVNPSRVGAGRGVATYEIGYTVSQDVRVDVSILSTGGRLLAQVSPSRAVTTGDNHLVWNGRDSAGRALPAGAYVLQLRAVNTNGDVSHEVRPLLITGR